MNNEFKANDQLIYTNSKGQKAKGTFIEYVPAPLGGRLAVIKTRDGVTEIRSPVAISKIVTK